MLHHHRYHWLTFGTVLCLIGFATFVITSRQLQAADENMLGLPTVQVEPGQPVVASILLTQTTGTVYAVDLRVTYDPDVVSAVTVQPGGAISSWSLASNLATPGIINLGMATGDAPLTAGGELVIITFLADEQAGSTVLAFTQGDLNEGDIPATKVAGAIVVNSRPIAVNDTYAVNEDDELTVVAAGVLTNDTDGDNNTLTAIQVSSPSHGTLTFNADGGFQYVPAENYFGNDSFSYRVSDGQGSSNTATVSLTIHPMNDTPTAVAGGPYTVDEGDSITLDGSASSDVENTGAQLTYEWDLNNDDSFETTGMTPSFSATALDGPAVRTVKLRVRDTQNALSTVATTQVNILNAAPTAQPGGPYTVMTGGTIQLDGTASSDPAGAADPLSYLWDLDDNGTFETTGATPTFDATALGDSTINIHLKVTDDDGAVSALASTTVTVQPLPTYDISGHTYFWRDDRPVSNVQLAVSGDGTYNATSQAGGTYLLADVPSGTYVLSAAKTDATSSITAYDAALVLRHVAGNETLSGHAATAADVNQTAGISALDASLILQRTVGNIPLPFADNDLVWQFDPINYSFAPLDADVIGRDFVGLLFGDVSGNWGDVVVQRAAQIQQVEWLSINEHDVDGTLLYEISLAQSLPSLYAVMIELVYDADEAVIQKVTPAKDGWVLAYNAAMPGTLKISLAGTDSLVVGDRLVNVAFAPTTQTGGVHVQLHRVVLNERTVVAPPAWQFLPFVKD